MELHIERLKAMCRLCTNRSLTFKELQKKNPAKSIVPHAKNVFILYGIDVEEDKEGVHPDKICSACYHRMMNSKKAGKREGVGREEELKLTGAYESQRHIMGELDSIWQPHSDGACSVCDLYERQKNPRTKTLNQLQGVIQT